MYHNHKAAGGELNVYRVALYQQQAKYVLAINEEDAAWQALALSKAARTELLDVVKQNG